MFSATVRLGQRFTSWYTVAIPASWAAPGEANTRSSPRTRMVPPSMPYTPVSVLIKVDFPAPFSPMSACTSPGRSRKPTPSSALTPGKPTVMSRISTTGDVVIGPPCTTQRTSQPGQMGHDGDGRHRPRREHLGSVLALRERGLRRSLVERGLLGEHPGRHSLAVLDLLGEVHELWAEQRAALDDKVDLSVGQRLHAVLHRVDGDDLDVLAGHLARRLDGLDGAEAHVVVLRVDHVDLRLRLQEGLHHLLAARAGEVTGLARDDLQVGVGGDGRGEALGAVDGRGGSGGALELHDVDGTRRRLLLPDEPVARLLALGDEVRAEERL